MAVFRIERTKDYTVMSNHHLRNRTLSLKAKGLLSMMLSLPDDWNYTTRGLSCHPALIDGFIDLVREEDPQFVPVTTKEIFEEAKRILRELRALVKPNGPEGVHYMVPISSHFMLHAGTKECAKLVSLLPFQSAAITDMVDRPVTCITILAKEYQSKDLPILRCSVREHLKQEAKQAAPKTHAHKKRGPER